jgi:hypothetical protein
MAITKIDSVENVVSCPAPYNDPPVPLSSASVKLLIASSSSSLLFSLASSKRPMKECFVDPAFCAG